MNWFEVKGQIRAMRLLQMAYAGGRMPHAWIFHGPGGAGKEMLAVRFAQLLLCEQPARIDPPAEAHVEGSWFDGCGQCRACHLVEAGTHPDLHVIDRKLNKHHPDPTVRGKKALDISVDVIRHFLLEPVRGRAAMGRAKIYIVRESELLSTAAQNALLKTLEEPPADTYIVLLSTARDRLLPTTLSRCQSVPFGSLEIATAEGIVAGSGLAGDDARFYAWLSEGRPGWALQLARFDVRKDYASIAEGLAKIGSADPLQTAAGWNETVQRWARTIQEQPAEGSEGDDEPETDALRQALYVLFVALNSLLREALRTGAAAPGQSAPPESSKAMSPLAKWGGWGLARGIKDVAAAESAIARNAAPPLTLEALAVKLAQISRGAPAGAASIAGGASRG